MRWIVHGERVIYDSEWVRLSLADVEVPGGRRFEHHVVRQITPAAGVIVVNDDNEILLLWRHRFISDTWGWEIPAGRADPGESLDDAARREVLEETGWEAGPLTRIKARAEVPVRATTATARARSMVRIERWWGYWQVFWKSGATS